MEIRYNFPVLLSAADSCASNVKRLSGDLDGLKQRLQPLLSTWDGDAKQAYYTRQSQWESAANDLRDLLGQIERALRASAEKMQSREAANKTKFE